MFKQLKIALVCFMLLFTTTTVNTGCDFDIDRLAESIDEASEKVRQGIDLILADSDRWKEIVLEDILPFIDKKLDWVIDDLNDLVAKTAQEVQVQAACIADRADDRVVNGLKTILSDMDGMRRHQFILPYVCSAAPGVLKLNHAPDFISVNGFDFIDPKWFQLYLKKADGTEVPVVEDRVYKTSNYLLNVRIGAWANSLKNYDALLLKYNGMELTEIPISAN